MPTYDKGVNQNQNMTEPLPPGKFFTGPNMRSRFPKNMGKINQDKTQTKYKGGNLQFTHGARMFLSQSTMTVEPKVGDFYFFPNYLMHLVYPFRDTKEERRSISFNAKIDEEIFDVYGKKS